MTDMHEFFRRARQTSNRRKDTQALEKEFSSMGPEAAAAFGRAYEQIDALAEPYARCEEEHQRGIIDEQVCRIIDNFLTQVNIQNGKKRVYRVRMHAHFGRKVAYCRTLLGKESDE